MTINFNINSLMSGPVALTYAATSHLQQVLANLMVQWAKEYQEMFKTLNLVYQMQFQSQSQKADQQITQGWVQFGKDLGQGLAVGGMSVAGEFAGRGPLKEAEALEVGPMEQDVVFNEIPQEEVVAEGSRASSPSLNVEEEATVEINSEEEARDTAHVREREEETAVARQERQDKIKQLQEKANMLRAQFNNIYAPMVQQIVSAIGNAALGYVGAGLIQKEGYVTLVGGIAVSAEKIVSNIIAYLQELQQAEQSVAQTASAMIQISGAA